MLHNPTFFGFSLLILSCASPALGVSTEASPGSGLLDATPTPSSPSLGINPSLPSGINPPETMLVPTSPTLEATADVVAPTAGSPQASTSLSNVAIHAASQMLATKGAEASLSTGDSSTSTIQGALKQTSQPPATPSPLYYLKHNKASSSAHKKLAAKLKSINPSAPVNAVSSASPSSASSNTPISSASVTPGISSSIASLPTTLTLPHFSITRAIVEPTSGVLDDPDSDARTQSASDASERARRRTILAAFLILGTLGALGGGILCFRCGVLPCCHRGNPHRRSRRSLEQLTEEGLRKPPRVASMEKSIIPGAPPMQIADLPVLPSRDSHTPSCSTCPDSLNGMRSGISGGLADWRVYATNQDGQFEDVTHILSSDAFSVRSADNERRSTGSWSARNSTASAGSGNEPQSSAHSRSASRASESGASMTAESYKSCESRYSTPSFERHSRDGPPPSVSASVASSLRSPSPSAMLLRTPVQADYTGLANAAIPVVVKPGAPAASVNRQMATVAESETEDMELDSQWDVAKAYASTPAKIPQNAGVGRRITSGTTVEQNVGTVDLGGRTCVLMRG
ncbi:hypothetical protein ONZ51_g1000 [Trametes cubensis]|uniref:Uncharacterized protein n=1 Tax=Trametes cubensis TaxID=1111947 RepID=A0AAD7U2C7_9APHY|nr:hypothetical protein ONZ51_g1000 [Trametes cubensis]